ncbi:hypothetical protein B4O97_16325 [Marispirochaeta aestuarii]|uniref:Helix-turn-helix domain-containing protein n=1 Tax=Marispirochaeta aestuarii TaxID=1963862 RepID=A0A1Y1RUC9_9SPIO|nr:helix-turn-helix domain-containing protein [Marispirochaeta aestuarii]ORC32629.1 hypothetical protein B4O97_16325 [Marispirochaeta aestuarii]
MSKDLLVSPISNEKRLLSYEEAAKLLCVAPITIRKWSSAGLIDTIKLGGRTFLTPEILNDFIAAGYRKANGRAK